MSEYKIAGRGDEVFDDGTSGPGAARGAEPLMKAEDFLRGAREWVVQLTDEQFAELVALETQRRINARE